MTLRLYLDEDTMDKNLVHALQIRGIDVMTALDAGMIEREDSDHLVYATLQERALYSYNVADYQRLHVAYMQQNKRHTGIILAQQQKYSVGEQMRRLLKIVAEMSSDEMQDRLEFLSAW
jgi:Domain of unknown function (DUF5615)